MKHKISVFSVIAIILFICSCGNSDFGGGTAKDFQTQDETNQPPFSPENFETRLNANLAVSGTRCLGGERPDEDNPKQTCNAGEWLIYLDDQNTCTSDLATCTEISVTPIIAKLNYNDNRSNVEATYYFISPHSPTTARQRLAISKLLIRTQANGDTEAYMRR